MSHHHASPLSLVQKENGHQWPSKTSSACTGPGNKRGIQAGIITALLALLRERGRISQPRTLGSTKVSLLTETLSEKAWTTDIVATS